MTWLCAQIGAREHYAVPRALHQTGRLAVLYTDFWAGPLTRALGSSKIADGSWKAGALRSLAARWHPELQENAETLNAEIKKTESRKVSTPHPGPLPGRGGEGGEKRGLKIADGRWKMEVVSWNWRALWWEVLRKRQTQSGKQKWKMEDGREETAGRHLSMNPPPQPSLLPRGGEGVRRTDEGVQGFKARIEIGRNLAPALAPDEAEREGRSEAGRLTVEDGGRDTDGANQSPLSAFSVSAFTPYHGFIEVGRRFATCVREDLKRRKDLGPDTIFYAYDTGALEAFAWCREHGVKCVLNQMDPNRVEVDLVRAEERQWPGWALHAIEVPEAYFNRREREWALADRIVVNSEFSRRALVQQGVPPEKLVVIPLCFEAKTESRKQTAESGVAGRHLTPALSPDEAERDGRSENGGWKMEDGPSSTPHLQTSNSDLPSPIPLRVLFLGQVILRKGIQYLMAAAKQLEHENIQFDIVGPVGISAAAIATAPKNVVFHGRTGRDQAAAWYLQSHLFVLPTLSDGFALTQLEAMAHGLPVVTTPCCGDVVSDGVDGFIVPPREIEPLVQVFRRYLADAELLRNQSAAALVKARQFTGRRLAENLLKLEVELKKAEN